MSQSLETVFQPIVGVLDHVVVGVEALSRFPHHDADPGKVFADAWRHGDRVGLELELVALRAALEHLYQVPDEVYLSINASPTTLMSSEFARDLSVAEGERLVVEVTEHAVVANYEALHQALDNLKGSGIRLAIDDAGTGFSGLDHIIRLEPDIIKIDAALVRDLDTSPGKQAMIAALTTFAARMSTSLVAEGIETYPEFQALRVLGVQYAQGYYLSRPQPIPSGFTIPEMASS